VRVSRIAVVLALAGALGANAFGTDLPLLDVEVFEAADPALTAADLTGDSNGSRFSAPEGDLRPPKDGLNWYRLRATNGTGLAQGSAFIVRQGRNTRTQLFVVNTQSTRKLEVATRLPGFRGIQDLVYVLPEPLNPDTRLYLRLQAEGRGSDTLAFGIDRLDQALAVGAAHSRMIAIAFGALLAVTLAALLLWFVLRDRLLILYSGLFGLQALYIAYLSGQGFEWPWLAAAEPLTSHTWNVPAALSGAIACLFVREIADLKRYSPRIYRIFGWMSVAFVVMAVANVASLVGLGAAVATLGNLLFLGTAVFTIVVCVLAWRRGNRAAGWFLVAWGLLEAFTIATTLELLFSDGMDAELLLYYGLPMSMVAASILVALGVADRLQEQRRALSDAERRAQTDPLTGVLNRGSLLERLEAACSRAQTRGLPLSLLFIDLDDFKQINDSRGHAAGDACLARVIEPIEAELRQSDVIGRYGGEEFVVILSSADAAAAKLIAERIRRRVSEALIEGFGAPIQLTCSIGVASTDTLGVWGERLIAEADTAVYAAKRSGRNCVQVASVAVA